jgi:hypothetical protein
MQWPYSWVILCPLQNDKGRCICVLSGPYKLNIASLRIRRVDDSAVPVAEAFGEHMEVMTVKLSGSGQRRQFKVLCEYVNSGGGVNGYKLTHMNWVCAKLEEVVYDQPDGAVGTKIVHIILGWEGEVAGPGIHQNGVVVVATESLAVHEPDECGAVAAESDVDGLVRRWVWIWGD